MVTFLLTPPGLYYLIGFIVILSLLVYWKREPIKGWLRRQEVSEIELGTGPVKVKLRGKQEPGSASSSAGVNFGEDNDFSGANIRDVAGRDIRRGTAAPAASEGQTPGVDFGKRGKFRDAEIEDIAGHDIVEE
jgi:hypothetical protein